MGCVCVWGGDMDRVKGMGRMDICMGIVRVEGMGCGWRYGKGGDMW